MARKERSGRRAARQERDDVGFVLPLLLLIAILALGWVATPDSRRPSLRLSLDRVLGKTAAAPSAAEEVWVDPAELSFEALADGVGFGPLDPRWIEELDAAAAGVDAFPLGGPEERAGCEALALRLGALSFVCTLPRVAVDSEHGLSVDLDLAEPVACVPVGQRFLTVDRDGVLLSGDWEVPPVVQGRPLPVLGPMTDADGLFALAQPGDWLEETAHLDALDVALSMRRHLEPSELARLGRVVIDATRARRASVEEPGVRLLLEGGRLVLFGRRPSTEEPGELPVERKWASLAEALDREASSRVEASGPWHATAARFDWRVLDVRWDRPELVPGPALVAALGPTR